MPESTTQMQLVASALFLNRMQYLLVQQALVVLSEALATAHHAARARYAGVIVSQPASQAAIAAVMVVGGVNLTSEAITGSGATADTTATDAEMLSQIATFWNALAGIDTGA